MSRVEIAAQGWGVVQDTSGNAQPSRTVTLSGTVYTTQTGSTVISPVVTNADGTIPGWIEDGTYALVVGGVSRMVEAAVAANVESYLPAAASTSAAIQSAVTAATSAGTTGGKVVFKPGKTYTLDTATIKLARSLPTKLHIDGRDATLALTTTAAWAFEFTKIADHDTFKNIEITDFTIDAAALAGQTGTEHVVIGTRHLTRVNVDQVAVRRVKTINVPVDATGVNHRLNIWFVVTQLGDAEATQNYLKNIVVEDCRFEGGNQGVSVGGTGGTTNLNVAFDEIYISRCWHSAVSVNSAPGLMSHYFVGSRAKGGKVTIEDCYGEYSGDVGVEVDAASEALVRNVTIKDAPTPFFHTNFNNPIVGQAAQRITFEDCHAIKVGEHTNFGYRANNLGGLALGEVQLINCDYHEESGTGVNAAGRAARFDGTIRKIKIDGLRSDITFNQYTDVSAASFASLYFDATLANGSLPTVLSARDLSFRTTLDQGAGAGAIVPVEIDLRGAVTFDIDGVVTDRTYTGISSGSPRVANVGLGTSSLSGRFHRIRPLNGVGSPKGLFFGATSTLTIPSLIVVRDCDFSLYGTTPVEIAFVTTGQNQDKVQLAGGNRWRVYPKPSAVVSTSNFAAATFTTAVGNQYIGGDAAEIHFATGTGAGITAIDVSKDGTTYENAYTQASGAMANSVLVPVDNADFVKVTFATTAPTVRVRPRR